MREASNDSEYCIGIIVDNTLFYGTDANQIEFVIMYRKSKTEWEIDIVRAGGRIINPNGFYDWRHPLTSFEFIDASWVENCDTTTIEPTTCGTVQIIVRDMQTDRWDVDVKTYRQPDVVYLRLEAKRILIQ